MENVKYKTVTDGIDLYLDAQTLVNRASHKNAIFTKKKIEREVNKGKLNLTPRVLMKSLVKISRG